MVGLQLNFELFGHPVIEYNSLQADGQVARIRNESLAIGDVSLCVAARAREVLDYRVCKRCLKTGVKRNGSAFLCA